MAKQVINLGTTINDGTGDTLRLGAEKINENFTELYDALSTNNAISVVSSVSVGAGLIASNPSGPVTINVAPATQDTLGSIKVGSGLSINESGVLSSPTYTLPKAASNILGGVKVGDNLTINSEGVLSAVATPYTLPTASSTTKGGIRVGTGLQMSGDVLNVVPSTVGSTLQDGNATLTYSEVDGLTHSILQSNFGVSLFSTGETNFTSTAWTNNTDVVNQVVIDSTGTSILHQDIEESSNNTTWKFRNDGILLGPELILGSAGTQDQILSIDGTHSFSIGNTDLKSYVRIAGPLDPGFDSGISRANKISIISNNAGEFVNGQGFTSQGRIELIAGGGGSPTSARIEMGELGDMEQAFPPTGDPVDTLTNHIEIVGGVAFYGDVILQGDSALGIRNKIIFQDGTEQTTAYQGESPAEVVLDSIDNGEFSATIGPTGIVTIPGTLTALSNLTFESLTDTNITAGEDLVITSSVGFALRNYSTTQGISIITALNDESESTWTFKTNGDLQLPAGGAIVDSSGNPLVQEGFKVVVAPTTSKGYAGNVLGDIAFTAGNFYYCTGTYDGTTDIWVKTAWATTGTWTEEGPGGGIE